MYAFHCFRDDVHSAVRLDDLLAADGGRFVAKAASKAANLAPGDHTGHAETIVTTVYGMVNSNLFSLPKMMLVSGIVAKQHMLLLKITSLILLSDWIKSTIVVAITTEVERVTKEVRDVSASLPVKDMWVCAHPAFGLVVSSFASFSCLCVSPHSTNR